jgi:hypothetical protein
MFFVVLDLLYEGDSVEENFVHAMPLFMERKDAEYWTMYALRSSMKKYSLHCPQLDHHDADGLAGQKTWRTTQTTMGRYKYAIQKSVHSS